jgi:hypothetical protein
MRRNIAASKLSVGFCILLLVAVFINTSCFAQSDEEPQQLYTFSYFQVKPGMSIEFEQFIMNSLPAIREMGFTQMSAYKTSNFGMSDRYLFITPLRDPAVMDTELSESQSNMPTGFVPMLSAIQRMVVSIHDFVLIPLPYLNIPPKEDYEWKLLANFTIGTAPGRSEDFEKSAKVAIDAIGKTNVKGILIGKVGLGGNLDEYIMSVFYDSFTDMMNNEPAVQKELAAVDLTPLTDVVYYRASEVMVSLPELSIQPAGQ